MCKAVKIPRSSFYYNRMSTAHREAKDKEVLEAVMQLNPLEIKKAGAKRKAQILKKQGKVVNHKRLARICKEAGLETTNRRRKFPKNYYQILKENEKNLPKNELNRDFKASEPLKKLCTDVSYFKVKEGWLYLSPILDLHDQSIAVYKISPNIDSKLACDTLSELVTKYKLQDAMIHSDQGAIYKDKTYRKFFKNAETTSASESNNYVPTDKKLPDKNDKKYQKALKQAKKCNLIQSMSRKGNCWDNACIERFFGSIKSETDYYETLKNGLLTYKEMEKVITDYIEYYNKLRIQKKLNWLSPVEFREKQCY